MAGLGGQPIIIIDPEKSRTTGRDAQSANIMAARTIANAVKTTLGPKGMDKMLVNAVGDITVTNDGAAILQDIDIQHPAAMMMVEISKTQEKEVGDGTTSAVVLAGELLGQAEKLIELDVHPTVIIKGFRLAAEKAQEILESNAVGITAEDNETLRKVALTALSGKGSEMALDDLADLTINAIQSIADDDEIDIQHNIQIIHQRGGSIKDTHLLKGMVIDKARAHKNMPKSIKNAKIAILDVGIEVQKTTMSAKIKISTPDELDEAYSDEYQTVKEQVDSLIASGANVVVTEKGIDDISLHYLAKNNILAIRRVKEDDLKKIVRATSALIRSNAMDVSPEDLGNAELVEERGIGNYKMIYFEGCDNPKAVTILVHSGADFITDEVDRALDDALNVVKVVLNEDKIMFGGGAPEIEVAMQLKEYASSLSGREQLAVVAFADAMEGLPRSLTENSGLDPVDILVQLRAEHKDGSNTVGLNVLTGEVMDMKDTSVIEPLKVKIQSIKSATDAVAMILRVDDVFASKYTGLMDVKPEHRMDSYDGIEAPDIGEDY
ncbi:MAG: TCP-1/cpn60 chaperonin family protein [Methanosarcinales archaeon]|nr:TCP-1/cpn60 chaperonin family protein [Methanosarcinales archaeon]